MNDTAPVEYVWVPREPTPEMLRAGFLSETNGFDIETPADAPGLVYRAMLEAAPQPSESREQPCAFYGDGECGKDECFGGLDCFCPVTQHLRATVGKA